MAIRLYGSSIVVALPAGAQAAEPTWFDSSWLLYSLPLAVGSIALLVIVGALYYFRSRKPSSGDESGPVSAHAVLSNMATKQQHTIDHIPWRVGRGRSNALTIDDHSVSRVHAEINQDTNGVFHVCDLESLNGVFVNEQRVDISALSDGDIVDIGDVRFQYLQSI